MHGLPYMRDTVSEVYVPHRTLGVVIHEAIDRLGMSLTDVATAAGIERSHMSRLAHDQSGVDVEKLKRLADVLHLDHGFVLRAAAASAASRRAANDAGNTSPDDAPEAA